MTNTDGTVMTKQSATRGRKAWFSLAAVCALVIGVYAYTAGLNVFDSSPLPAADYYYNLLVQGFRDGHLSLKKEIPPGFAQLTDPYNPSANAIYRLPPYRMHDLAYYKGRLYLDFGVTPALILFWPFVALTGHYLFHREAAAIFCAIGFLSSVGLLRALWQRYFAEIGVVVVAACALALGLATLVPVMLTRSEIYEVAIGCGYMLTMLALGAIWCALHEPERRGRWLAVSSVAYGLAVGARPNLLFGAVVLLVPVVAAWRERRQVWILLGAATGPIVLIGLGLMLYNYLRFDNPFEFGKHYVLREIRQATQQFFSPRYFWFNFRAVFLEPVRWSSHFPFVEEISLPSPPSGHWPVESPFGLLPNIPLIWLALAAPLAWRGRSAGARAALGGFSMALALFIGICALTVCFFCQASCRYEVEFLPALSLLAVVGIFGLERTLAPCPGSGQPDRPVRRHAARWGWGLLLGFSVVFNLLACVQHYAQTLNDMGAAFDQVGRVQDAITQYEHALRLKPDFAEAHYGLGVALEQTGKIDEAIRHYEQALRIQPDFAEAHYNLGAALERTGRAQDALGQWEQALRINPEYAEAHYNLGLALARLGRVQQAQAQWEQALRINPEYAEAHYGLGIAMEQAGKIEEAIRHYEQAVRIKPDYVEPHYSLGAALERTGRTREAIEQYEQVVRIQPGYADAQAKLDRLLVALPGR